MPKTKIVLVIRGGCLASAHVSDPKAEIVVYDIDNLESDGKSPKQIDYWIKQSTANLTAVWI